MTTPASRSQATLRQHGRSFHWAGHFLPADQLKSGARLYHVCRQVDDIADNATTDAQCQRAKQMLCCLQQQLAARSPNASSPSLMFLEDQSIALAADGVPTSSLSATDREVVAALEADICSLFNPDSSAFHAMQDLLATMTADLTRLHLNSQSALLHYAYGAAGTVGVMMCHLLDANEHDRALAFAIDLGIAMQMTNIARDVLEDAKEGRLYLPAAWMSDDVTTAQIVAGDVQARQQAWQAIQRLLVLAEHYYLSGWQGLAFLPVRARLAIGVALRVYRDIGRRIQRLDAAQYWGCRVVVPGWAKAYQSVLALSALTSGKPSVHNAALHQPLGSTLSFYGIAQHSDLKC
ncbi:squalene/phytoene synthase family protein [Vreelandella andesensis]|uniref:Squalene/phytoene synthase family protein n=1 Tax=Vreelandella andesensis TaxID=447567 RepID=A0A3S0W348_9GAMM|nr:squalene/phytoene synthase family protein [Halomonas andesensis]RUR27196.1 squalene/phytoene synthase family protein [Halomonas andesensis]